MAMLKRYREDFKYSSRIFYYILKTPIVLFLSQKIFLIFFIVGIIGLFIILLLFGEIVFSNSTIALPPSLITLGIMIGLMILFSLLLYFAMVFYVTIYSLIIGIENFLIVFGEKKKVYLKPLKIVVPILIILFVLSVLITISLYAKQFL